MLIKKFFAALILTVLLAATPNAYAYEYITYQGYVQNIGWQEPVRDGEIVGTVGKALALEALIINFNGGIKCSAHVQNIGWKDWVYSGETVGTVGQGLHMEAIRIDLTGRSREYFDVYYRAHVQNGGWLGWAKNGEPAGTAGANLRLEALQIQLVEKGKQVDYDRSRPAFYQRTVNLSQV